MSKGTQITPKLDAEFVQNAANEAAEKGAVKEIEDFYNSYSSPYRKKIREELEKKDISFALELPDIIAVLNESLKDEVDRIANNAIAQTYIPMVQKFLVRIDKEINFSDILKEFVRSGDGSYFTSELEVSEVEGHSWLDVSIADENREYNFTLHSLYKENNKRKILSLPRKGSPYRNSHTQTMTLKSDNFSLEMPFERGVLDDDFTAYIAKIVIGGCEITMDTESFDEDWFHEDCHC